MDQHRPKLHEFHVLVGSPSHDLPACREVSYSLSLIGEQEEVIERRHSALVYAGLLGDSDQVPWLIAHILRTMLKQKDDPSQV
jgi:hypothetical protein